MVIEPCRPASLAALGRPGAREGALRHPQGHHLVQEGVHQGLVLGAGAAQQLGAVDVVVAEAMDLGAGLQGPPPLLQVNQLPPHHLLITFRGFVRTLV